MEKQHSQTFLQQRKLMVFLPFVGVHFLAIFFYLFGGGNSHSSQESGPSGMFGLNTSVPTASEENKIYSSKLQAYQQISADSITWKKRNRFSLLDSGMDALLSEDSSSIAMPGATAATENTSAFNYDINRNRQQQMQAPEQVSLMEAQHQIEKANQVASGEKQSFAGKAAPSGRSYSSTVSGSKDDINRKLLEDYEHKRKQQEEIMALLKKKLEQTDFSGNAALPFNASHSPESDAQTTHSSTQKNKLTVKLEKEEKPLVTQLVQTAEPDAWATYQAETLHLPTDHSQTIPKGNNGFYSPGKAGTSKEEANTIMAVIHNAQTIVAGATVKMRLQHNIQIGSTIIPKGSFVFGVCSISDERLKITINSIRYREMLFPIELSVFDLDGIEGLYMPGSLSRTTAKQGASQGLSSSNFIGTSPTVTSQLTQTAIEAGKNIVSKKASIIRVKLKSNYQILLRPSQTEE